MVVKWKIPKRDTWLIVHMNCPICNNELTTDLFGLFCPNELCCYISKIPDIVNEKGIIPLLYENEILIKFILINSGTKKWHLNGKLHRENGPAIEYVDGAKEWYLNGKLHREDGPAIECPDGRKYWYLNGDLHRENGPAFEHANGRKEWYLNGIIHREDGPAIEFPDGRKYWYLNGKFQKEILG